MAKKARSSQRREESLSRDRIIEASIELLDSSGEGGLTFRALSERLATGPGAIYWHIANKSDLLTAACDAIVARTMEACLVGAKPKATIRALALGMFDAIDAHPWVGSALARPRGSCPWCAFSNPWASRFALLACRTKNSGQLVCALLNYILGVGGQNAANGQLARDARPRQIRLSGGGGDAWSQLDPHEYPFTRSVAGQVRAHDDRVDFLAGIDLILRGIDSLRRRNRVLVEAGGQSKDRARIKERRPRV